MQQENCLISIIVPVYKVEKYLDRCVESIVNQTYKNLEIILVDDGSPDKCPVMCDEWAKKDSRIRVIHKKNGGISDARNAGLNIVRGGAYISFIDSDDWIDSQFIEKMVRYADDKTIVCCGINWVEGSSVEDRHVVDKVTICSNIEFVNQLFDDEIRCLNGKRIGIGCAMWNKLFPASLFSQRRFVKGLFNEDIFLMSEIVQQDVNFVLLPESLYYYFRWPGSLVANLDIKKAKQAICIWEHWEELFENHGILYDKIRLVTATYLASFSVRFSNFSMGEGDACSISDAIKTRIANNEAYRRSTIKVRLKIIGAIYARSLLRILIVLRNKLRRF